MKHLFERSTAIAVLTLLLAGLALWAASGLPVFMYPQTQRAQVQVNVSHPGISALDFQEQYAQRFESRFLGLEGLETLQTTYSTDSSQFVLIFEWNRDRDLARADVQAAVAAINPSLPEEIRDRSSVRNRDSENAGYIVIGAVSATLPSEQLYRKLKDEVEPLLNRIEDAEELALFNTQQTAVQVTLQPRQLLTYGLTVNDVQTALQANFNPQPLGSLRTADQRFSVRLHREKPGLSDLASLPVKALGNSWVTLDSVAEIVIRRSLPSRVFVIQGQPAVQISATPREGGSLTALSDDLKTQLEQAVQRGLVPADTQFHFYLDPAKYISRSISQVIEAALFGGLLAVLVVFLILGEVRNTLIVAASLPLSLIFSLGLMAVFGMSLNLISLGGLALAVGMIVDSTIVVMENIHRLRLDAGGQLKDFRAWRTLILQAVREVRAPVVASTLTTIAVFLPLTFTAPLTNAILGDQARTVVFALVGSLLVSLTLVPLLAYYLYRRHGAKPAKPFGLTRLSEGFTAFLVKNYRSHLEWILAAPWRRWGVLLLSSAALALAVGLVFPQIPKEIMPVPQSDRLVLFFRHERVTTAPEVLSELLPSLEARVHTALGPLARQVFTNLMGRFNQMFIDLPAPRFVDEAMARMQAEFVSEGDWYFNVLPWDPSALPLPQSFDLQLSLNGPEIGVKTRLLGLIQEQLQASGLYRRVFSRPSSNVVQELALEARQETINALAPWNETSLSLLIRRLLGGTSALTLKDGNEDISVQAQFDSSALDSLEKLETWLVPWQGRFVPLGHWFLFRQRQGVSQIQAENGELIFQVLASAGPQVSDAQRQELAAQARAWLTEHLRLPEGYTLNYENPRLEIDRSLESLYLALVLAVALIYLLLTFQYNNLWIPLLILITIPFGILGVVLALAWTGATLNLNSLLGSILLGGLVVNNAILMVDFFLQRRHEAKDFHAGLVLSCGLRFPPILITTLTTLLGMLPLALGWGEGANILQPLGIAVSGGLALSTFMTLYVFPVLLSFSRRLLPGGRP